MNEPHENTFNGLPGDAEVESRARAVFRTACEQTDSYHALRLGLARRKAANAGASHAAMRVWAPLAGAAACCALVAGVVWLQPAARLQPATPIAASTPAASIQSDTDDVIPDVNSNQMDVAQNLDFYRWLAAQPAMATAATPAGSGR